MKMRLKQQVAILVGSVIFISLGCRHPPTDRPLPPGEIPGMIVHETQRPIVDWGIPTRGAGLGFVWPEHRHLPPLQRPQTEEIFTIPWSALRPVSDPPCGATHHRAGNRHPGL